MREPRVCAVVTGQTTEDLLRGRDAAAAADMVELRLDFADQPDVARVLEGRPKPVIATCRASWEGGRFSGTEDERRRILELALAHGAEYVDVEAAAGFAADLVRATGGRRIVISEHKFDKAPTDLPGRFAALEAKGAEVAKLAFAVSSLEEMLPLFGLAAHRPNGNGRVLIAMGNVGLASRILAARLGSQWTYVGDQVAPGQLSMARLLEDFRFRRIAPDAALYGVVGNPIVHSRSPIMHNAGFAALGLNAVYVPLEARDAEDFAGFARETGLRGASITTPFKVSLLPYVDEIDPLAQRVGAINTLIVRDDKWIGANTDVDGFLAPLKGRIELKGTRAMVLGAGGAARAVGVALADRGAHVTICARRPEAARTIATLVNGSAGEMVPPPGSWDLLVNATTVGSDANPGNPMGDTPLDGRIVYDLVYAPAETALLKSARASGCQTVGGMDMLIAQAERQFELWIGQRPPEALFRHASGRPSEVRHTHETDDIRRVR
jgi:3-dehydroquinate dehydratase / shikimate dehydrogenase